MDFLRLGGGGNSRFQNLERCCSHHLPTLGVPICAKSSALRELSSKCQKSNLMTVSFHAISGNVLQIRFCMSPMARKSEWALSVALSASDSQRPVRVLFLLNETGTESEVF